MKHKTYDNISYWQRLMEKYDDDWGELFSDKPITESTIICHFVIVNCYGLGHENTWVAFPNYQAVVGFLKHVFLPTAYVEWIMREKSEGYIVIEAPVYDWLELLRTSDKAVRIGDIPLMEKQIAVLEECWHYNREDGVAKLREFAHELSMTFTGKLDVFFYYQLFASPEEVGEFMINSYEEEGYTDMLEKDLGVTIEEWRSISTGVKNNEFMRRKFIKILNNRVNDML